MGTEREWRSSLKVQPDDPLVVKQALHGDADALSLLVQTHRPWVQRVAERFTRDPDLVQDVQQDAFLEARRSIANLRQPSKFGAWYCGIVLNLCRRRLANRTPHSLSLDALHGGVRFEAIDFTRTGRDPADVAEERETFAGVIEAVADLPEAYRSATALFYLRQLSVQEVASVLGISVGAVKVRLHRARQQLRRQVAAAEIKSRISVGSGFKPDRSQKNRSKPMAKVKIVDVINRTAVPEGDSPPAQFSIVVLADESNRRALPIWIGRHEGAAIALGVRHRVTPRPLTYVTFGELLRTVGAGVTSVEINRLDGSTYHAGISLNTGSGARTVDARPSDALALAVQFDAPVYVADAVMSRAGVDIADTRLEGADGRSIDAIVAEIEDPKRWGAPSTGMSDEERDRACRELINEVFGSAPAKNA